MDKTIKLSGSTALLIAVGILAAATTVAAGELAGSWSVDSDRSEIRFVSDAPMERFTGTTDDVDGTIQFEPDDPSATTGTLEFPVDSVTTGNSTRDRHLTQEDWLHADEYPTVSFEIDEFRDVEVAETDDRIDYQGTATGNVTLRGTENSEDAEVEVAILPDRDLARVQFELDFAIEDYGVEGTRDRGIGSSVGETIDVDGTVYADKE